MQACMQLPVAAAGRRRASGGAAGDAGEACGDAVVQVESRRDWHAVAAVAGGSAAALGPRGGPVRF